MKTFKVLKILMILAGALFFFRASADTIIVETGQFEKLKINGNFSVIYKNLPDSTGYAVYESPTPKNIFTFSTKGDGVLKVEPADEKWGRKDLPVVYLYSDFLTSLESQSDQIVEVESVAPCASLSINQVGNGTITVKNIKCNNLSAALNTGNGTINLSGKCVNANFRMVGAGLISADRLQAENVKCRILGTGSIGCWPLAKLNVTGLGTTKIYYKGEPEIKKSGGGKLFELPEDTEEEYFVPSGGGSSEVGDGNSHTQEDVDEDTYEDEDDDEGDDEEEDDDDIDEDDSPTVVTKDD